MGILSIQLWPAAALSRGHPVPRSLDRDVVWLFFVIASVSWRSNLNGVVKRLS